jgi:integrase/recombinase XerD
MLEELQRRNFAPTTVSTYLHAVEQFARHFKYRRARLNQTHFRSYQAYLLRERKMQPLTVRLHVAALRFFFVKTLKRRYSLDDTPYPKASRRLPQILSVEEVARVCAIAHCYDEIKGARSRHRSSWRQSVATRVIRGERNVSAR